MDIKVKAFSEYERYKKERTGKPFKSMGDADWFVAGFLAASSTSSNSDYAKSVQCLECRRFKTCAKKEKHFAIHNCKDFA